MIGDALTFTRQSLDRHLRVAYGGSLDDADDAKVVFVDGDKFDPIQFKLGAVSLLVVNVEEERVMRPADAYVRSDADGKPLRVQPTIRLVLHLLCVAHFKQYDSAWDHLSKIIEYFQTQRVVDRETAASLPPRIERLVFELMTLGFSEQNEVWSALRTTQLPSVLYRISLVSISDHQPADLPQVTATQIDLGQKST